MAGSRRGNKFPKNNSGSSKRDKYRGKKRGATEREDASAAQECSARNSSLNDLSWYSRNPNLLVAAGQFPYPYRPGMLLDLNGEGTTVATAGVRLPGVLVMEWVPSFGNSSTSTDPASIAGKEFYGRVRAAYSGALDADAPDFMVYVGGLDSVFAYIGWLKRVYRTISTYSPDNLEMPDALMGAYGFDDPAQISDFRSNKTRFWQGT